MGMSVGSGNYSNEPEVLVDINTTPLIDVMLVLLIMLIITIPVQTHAVKLDMPNGAQNSGPPPPVVKIDIDFDGTVTWNGQIVPDRATLDSRFLTEAINVSVQPEVQIKPNKLATYKYVAAVLASAQRLGVTKIGVVGSEQYIQ
jgi:biopolymer transport protein ExbD